MVNTGQKLEKKGVIAMTLLTLVLIGTGCEDKIDSPAVNPSEGKTVEVALNIGFANEADGYDLSASTKALPGKEGTFNVELTPTTTTRTTAAKPNALYKLEIRQYSQEGTHLSGSDPKDQTIGEKLTVNLQEATNCQLVFVAWGEDSPKSLGGIDLPKAQEIEVDASVIKSITDDTMNKMPYILHLKHVDVTGSGPNGVISSPNGEDVRILLKRLATRLTLNWSYPDNSDYSLKQILLESIPLNYKVIPKPDEKENNTYPSIQDQYTTIQLSEGEIKEGHYTCWIPANVRGTNNESNSPLYRIKANAPLGSSYASFIAGNKEEVKKKLNYRVYLGGSDYTDFNLYGNTDYSYIVNFKHTELPVNDRRVTIIDPIPASENNENLVPTANCFMVAPGGAFCFNPYIYFQNGEKVPNDLLQEWCKESKIQSVKVLWQTKENGDVGDPVLGVVNSSDDHTNIVALTSGDDFEKARIYCRVAPNTTGGSGLIAAYDKNKEIVWSWHIWVTDYSPDARGDNDVQTPENKRKQKYVGNNAADQLPMMDRNLGAIAGYAVVPATPLEQSKTNGLHYQQGRKDPFPSSYSAESKSTVPGIYSSVPPKDMLNLYGPDGLTYKPRERGEISGIRNAYKAPLKMYTSSTLSSSQGDAWAGNSKTMHDPCPAGWRIAKKENYQALFVGNYYVGSTVHKFTPRLAPGFEWDDGKESGGYLIVYNNNNCTTYFRMTGFGNNSDSFVIVGEAGNIWTRDYKVTFDFGFNANTSGRPAYEVAYGWNSADAHATRCIQEQK